MEYQRLAQLLSSLVGTAEGALTAELRGPEASKVEPPEVTGRRAAVLSSILRIVEVAKAATAARTIAGLRMALDELTAIVDVIHKEGDTRPARGSAHVYRTSAVAHNDGGGGHDRRVEQKGSVSRGVSTSVPVRESCVPYFAEIGIKKSMQTPNLRFPLKDTQP